MSKFTRLVLKRPVTTVLAIISLVFFGIMSIFNMKLELTPEISMPMLVVTTVYPGAAPEDIDELITKPIEDEINTLDGVDSITGSSYENYSMILLQYEYGTNMDNAYTDLRKRLDGILSSLPEDAVEPTIIEMDVNQMASMYVVIKNPGVNNIYNYTKKYVVPELEKISSVASVDIAGGREEYISIRLDPEKLAQYRLDMNSIASIVGAASFTVPAGNTDIGNTEMNVSLGVEYRTPEDLKRIPISYGNGNIIYLEDVADISRTEKEAEIIGRYNGEDAVVIGINRNQSYTAANVSKSANRTFDRLKASDPNLEFVVVSDTNDDISGSLLTVFETMILAIVLSTVVLYLFYGDIKGSLIVATSIPVSIITALVMMGVMGYSLNVITMGSMVLAVGMMVDNSIVVLESCFRAMEVDNDKSFAGYMRNAVSGSDGVAESVLGSTLTTCVVFLPLGFLNGLSGQFFKPLGMTIVFSMAASLISAVAIVPLCFVYYRPTEKEKAPVYGLIRRMQNGYRSLEHTILRHKKKTAAATAVFLILSLICASQLKMVMMPEIDQGLVQVTVTMKPGLTMDKQLETYQKLESRIMADEDTDKVMLQGGNMGMGSSGSASFSVYLKDDRKKSTDEAVELWKRDFQSVDNCDIEVSAYSMTGMMNVGAGYSLTLVSSDYEELKAVNDRIFDCLQQDKRLTAVSSTLEDAAPVIKFRVDPVAASAEGFVPAQLAGSLYSMLSGTEADKMTVDGEELSVMVEYPEDEFDTLEKVSDIQLTSPTGSTVFLRDVADVAIEDSPAAITRYNKQYQATISAGYTDLADKSTAAEIAEQYVRPNLSPGVSEQTNVQLDMMYDEFKSLGTAIAIAVFLVFVVMAAQFESPRFSFMVMTTIPFAMIGSFSLLWLLGIDISMPTLIGFLMLVGTVVNNGILYVDSVDQLRKEMVLEEAVVEAGALRLRPMMMTTLTTVLSMLPMGIGFGDSGALMQGLAIVNIGGLVTSTALALLVLPVYYLFMNKKKKKREYEEIEA